MKLPALCLAIAVPLLLAADWPQWGGTPGKNMVGDAKGLPATCEPGKVDDTTGNIDLAAAKNIKWAAKLGHQTYGNPVVAGGKVYVGTNNENPRDPKFKGDYSTLYCFNEADGKFLWQLACPKLPGGKNVDWEGIGICSSPAVDVPGNRLYVVTNRCEVLCLDTAGMSNGNDGPYKDEAAYHAGDLGQPIEPGPTDADILWRFDMYNDLGVFPHYQSASSPLLVGDKVFVCTSNSRDWAGHTPAPQAPALICLDARTGKLLAAEASGISSRTFASNWSSPSYGKVGGQEMVFFGGGDGWVYAFDPTPGAAGPDGVPVLREIWRFDANPAARRVREGKPAKYGTNEGPSEVVATPVFHEGRVYAIVGQNPENGQGKGCLSCIDPTKTGDITATGAIWRFEKIERSLSTPAISGDLLFVADIIGMLYCIDIKTGQPLWKHDTQGEAWGSALVADGKVYIGNQTGEVTCLAATRELKELGKSTFETSVLSSPITANDVLFISSEKFLYAISSKK